MFRVFLSPFRNEMNVRFGLKILLICVVFGVSSCATYSTIMERAHHNDVALDAWARGQRAEERRDYQKAKERYDWVSRIIEERGETQ